MFGFKLNANVRIYFGLLCFTLICCAAYDRQDMEAASKRASLAVQMHFAPQLITIPRASVQWPEVSYNRVTPKPQPANLLPAQIKPPPLVLAMAYAPEVKRYKKPAPVAEALWGSTVEEHYLFAVQYAHAVCPEARGVRLTPAQEAKAKASLESDFVNEEVVKIVVQKKCEEFRLTGKLPE